MTLIDSGSKDAIGKNIKTEMDKGVPQKQAVAKAIATAAAAEKSKYKKKKKQ